MCSCSVVCVCVCVSGDCNTFLCVNITLQLILGAQCHAVRDTQIQEKKQILSEMQEEERRLDAMMEVDRRRALELQEQIDELRKNQRIQ